MAMTEKGAIRAAIRGWKKLAANGKLRKEDLPELKKYTSQCPLCQYALEEQREKRLGRPQCVFCPYNNAHPRRRNSEGSYACEHENSPYTKWDMTYSVKFSERYAARFVAELEALLG
jgi:hypothetical protein